MLPNAIAPRIETKTPKKPFSSLISSNFGLCFSILPVKQNSNRKIMDRLANTLYSIDKKFEMFWVSEWHRSGSSVHNHLLVKGDITQDIDRFWTSNKLSDKKFISHIKYEKDKGANYYVAKYLDKNIEYDYICSN